MLFLLSAQDYDELEEELHGSVSAFSQIGPPRNLSVDVRPGGFLVRWESPEYGQDMLGIYIIRCDYDYLTLILNAKFFFPKRWFIEPDHIVHGSVETRNNYYTGTVILSFVHWDVFENILCFAVPIDSLADGRLYTFQVSSVSTNNYEAFSKEFEIITPQYKIYQAIIVGAVSLLILLACAGILFYLKRHLFTNYSNEDKV